MTTLGEQVTEGKIQKYGLEWPTNDEIWIERQLIRNGGKITFNGVEYGHGEAFHIKAMQQLLWPHKQWHRWNELMLNCFCNNRMIGILGAASTGKTHEAALFSLIYYFCWPQGFTGLVSSTDSRSLELRIWGEMKKHWTMAKEVWGDCPGNIIESRQMIVTDDDTAAGRDFRNGCIAIPCFSGNVRVETETGIKPIKDVQVNEKVRNAIGWGRVTQKHISRSPSLLRVKLIDGRTIDCTPEHPFFTTRGWIKAVDLNTLDAVLSPHETMQIMRHRHQQPLPESEVLLGLLDSRTSEELRSVRERVPANTGKEDSHEKGEVLLHGVRGAMGGGSQGVAPKQGRGMQVVRGGNDRGSSHEGVLLEGMPASIQKSEVPVVREGIHFHSGKRLSVGDLRHILSQEASWPDLGEEEIQPAPIGTADSIELRGNGISARDIYWHKRQARETHEVSSGSGNPGSQARRRGRWQDSRHSGKEGGGSQTGSAPFGVRVDSVEVLPLPDLEGPSGSPSGHIVYNLAVTGHPSYSAEGVVVHNCVVGGSYVGLGKYVGVKNDRVLLVGDELSFMGRAYVDAISNLSKNRGFKLIAMGNPKDPTDALGTICEPHDDEGGWEGVVQDGKTRTWKTRWAGGIAIQLPGTDSPNMDVDQNAKEPYQFLIGRKSIQQDLEYYGRDSLNFSMMCLGTMPRTSQRRRVITKELVAIAGAKDRAMWLGNGSFLVAGVDAAYSAVGGDRTVMVVLRVGKNEKNVWQLAQEEPPVIITAKAKSAVPVEDQIAEQVMKECSERGIPPRRMYYDSTARGAFASSLARVWSVDCHGVEFGGRPSDRIVSDVIRLPADKHFSKRVSEFWFYSRYAIEAKQVKQLTDDLIEEGCQREWDVTAGNLVDVERKTEVRKRIGKSPDIYDAFVVAIEGARREGFEITKLANMSEEDVKESQMFYLELANKSRSIGRKNKLSFTT